MPPELRCSRNGRIITLSKSPFTIGRELDSDYVFYSQQVSRNHCVFRKSNGGWSVEDFSTNGTIINGVSFTNTISPDLNDGDEIQFHNAFIYKFYEDPPASTSNEAAAQGNNNNPQSSEAIVDLDYHDDQERSNILEENDDGPTNERRKRRKMNNDSTANDNVIVIDDQQQSLYEELEEELNCMICREIFIDPVTLECGHTMCEYCLTEWQKSQWSCPICRAPIKTMPRSLVLTNVMERVLQKMPADKRQQREASIAGRNMANADPAPVTYCMCCRPRAFGL